MFSVVISIAVSTGIFSVPAEKADYLVVSGAVSLSVIAVLLKVGELRYANLHAIKHLRNLEELLQVAPLILWRAVHGEAFFYSTELICRRRSLCDRGGGLFIEEFGCALLLSGFRVDGSQRTERSKHLFVCSLQMHTLSDVVCTD